MSRHWWTVIIAALVVGLSDANSESTAFPDIPKHLLDCYMNDGIYHRANRFPNTLPVFLNLIEKLEKSPTSRNLNARELSLVLLHYLKLDGIQSLQAHGRTPSNILPFAPSGDEYFMHRLTLVGLVARIDPSYMTALNETLTKKELCNLHFMLSYSIDPYKRENERCSPLYEEVGVTGESHRGESNTDWYPYQTLHHGYYPDRSIRHSIRKRDRKLDNVKVSTGVNGTGHTNDRVEQIQRRRRSNEDKKSQVETIYIQHEQVFGGGPKVTEKDKFTVGNQELLGHGEHRPRNLQSLVQFNGVRYGSKPSPYPRTSYSDDGSVYSGLIPGLALSECPSVNGIITTPYGSLAIGFVVTGIAAGLNPSDIDPTKLSVSKEELENPMDRVNNIWAATLAGVVANTISSSVLLDTDNLQILKGGWNDTLNPKWYLLRNSQFRHLPEVVLRGSLDGLFLGLGVREIMNKYSNMKLSELLRMYYEFPADISAANRVRLRPQYAPDEMFRKQVHLMSLVLKKQKTNVVTVLDHGFVTRDMVARVSNFIQNMDNNLPGTSKLPRVTEVAYNLVMVVDAGWNYENLVEIAYGLVKVENMIAQECRNLTMVCGSDGRTLLSVESHIELLQKFTKNTLARNCSDGMNFPVVFEALGTHYRKQYQREEESNKVAMASEVVVLLPHDSFVSVDREVAEMRSREFQQTFPDVRLMVAANGRSEAFAFLVRNPKYVFAIAPISVDPELKSVSAITKEILAGHIRLSRPSCGSYFDDVSQGPEVRFAYDITPKAIQYLRLLPQYFFTSRGTVTISIRQKQRSPLTVCHSRTVERPSDSRNRGREDVPSHPHNDYNTRNYYYPNSYASGRQMYDENDPVQCKTITGEVYKIEMTDPCYSAYTLDECQPLYISIEPAKQEITPTCSMCRAPYNIGYEVTSVGLTCYNSAVSILTNPLVLIGTLLLQVGAVVRIV